MLGLDIGIKRLNLLKSGEEKPECCGRCDYCKQTKIITRPVLMSELLEE